MTWNVVFTPEADVRFDKLKPLVASAFLKALDELAAGNPYGHERLVPPHFPFVWKGQLFKPRVLADGDPWLVTAFISIDEESRTITVASLFAQPIPDYADR